MMELLQCFSSCYQWCSKTKGFPQVKWGLFIAQTVGRLHFRIPKHHMIHSLKEEFQAPKSDEQACLTSARIRYATRRAGSTPKRSRCAPCVAMLQAGSSGARRHTDAARGGHLSQLTCSAPIFANWRNAPKTLVTHFKCNYK